MVRFNRNNLRPINSVKHVIDRQGGLIAGTQVLEIIADGKDQYLLSDADGIPTGSHVKGIFLNIQVAASNTAGLTNVYMMIYKNPGNNITVIPDANVIGVSDFKKQVFHQDMTMTEKNTTAIPRTLFKGVLKIPRHMQRMAAGDKIVIALFSPTSTWDYCIQTIYKHYS